jgi:hypothetical protein
MVGNEQMAAGLHLPNGYQLVGFCNRWFADRDHRIGNNQFSNSQSCIGKSGKKFKNGMICELANVKMCELVNGQW